MLRVRFIVILLLLLSGATIAQNVGIGTTSPNAYGHGGTNRLLEIYNAGTTANSQSHVILTTAAVTAGSIGTITWASPSLTTIDKRLALISSNYESGTTLNTAGANLGFYTRSSSNNLLTERMRIDGSGNVSFADRLLINSSGPDGINLSGRIVMKNGTNPVDINYGPGLWLYKADNSSLLGFIGTQNNQNIGFYGGTGGWGFTYDAINSRVGIGNNNPDAPLSFGATLGKKITLYPGAIGDAGLGISGNRLQIFSDNANADVAIGYDSAGTFNERFAVKPNGALAVYGNTGAAGQILTSNGNASPQWIGMVNAMPYYSSTVSQNLTGTNAINLDAAAITFTVAQTTRVFLMYRVQTFKSCLLGPCNSAWQMTAYLDGNLKKNYAIQGVAMTEQWNDDASLGPEVYDVGPGTHTLTFIGQNKVGNPTIALTPCMFLLSF